MGGAQTAAANPLHEDSDNPDDKIRVVYVDDSFYHREMVLQMMRFDPQIEMICAAEDQETALRAVEEYAPEVAIVDLYLFRRERGFQSGIDTIRKIREISDYTRIAAYTGYPTPQNFVAAIQAGAIGYIHKDARSKTPLATIIRRIASHEMWFDPDLLGMLFGMFDAAALPPSFDDKPAVTRHTHLTRAEEDNLRLWSAGNRIKEIAEKRSVVEATVKGQLASARKKLGVEDTNDAVRAAKDQGLIT
jgi:DNA-binding NarL/FixJ family response regulator